MDSLRFIRWCAGAGVFWAIMVPVLGIQASEPPDRADKRAIITLIEDRLSNALTIQTPKDRPRFGILDEVYPEWHGGNPTRERRRWTFHEYQEYRVAYQVRTVYIPQPGVAVAKGVKQTRLARLVRFSIFPPELKKETTVEPFTMTCRRKPTGEWEIIRETIG
ncbi:MAG: hypothetical protein ACOC3A_07005 [Thermodesulfobacteriota bacterium]